MVDGGADELANVRNDCVPGDNAGLLQVEPVSSESPKLKEAECH